MDSEELPLRDLAQLTKEDWDTVQGEAFRWLRPDGTEGELRLTAVRIPHGARPFRDGGRLPYSLTLVSPPGPVYAQSIYTLQHPVFGRVEIFIVPVASDADGVRYDAQFT